MNILAPTATAEPMEMTFYEVAFLQSADEIREMDGLLEDHEQDSLILDLIISEYDFLAEMPYQEAQTIGQIWLPSFRTVTETMSYIVIRDVFGNYAIYKKAWL